MQQIAKDIYINEAYPGITLGAIIMFYGGILIDAPPQPDDGRSWRIMLRNLGTSMGRLLVNLDSHLDRTIGARALECPVMAHSITAERIQNRPAIFKGQNPDTGSEWEMCDGLTGTRWAKPNLTFTHRAILEWDDYPVYLEHHPGPEAGAIWIIIPESNVMFVGDAVVSRQPPFLSNAAIPAWVEALDLLLSSKYRNYLIVSSRGGIVDQQVIREQRQFLKEVQKRLERLNDRGAKPEATESLISNLLSRLEFPLERYDHYTQRLRYGLYRYYINHYQPNNEQNQDI